MKASASEQYLTSTLCANKLSIASFIKQLLGLNPGPHACRAYVPLLSCFPDSSHCFGLFIFFPAAMVIRCNLVPALHVHHFQQPLFFPFYLLCYFFQLDKTELRGEREKQKDT